MASLRVYEPLESFSEAQQNLWRNLSPLKNSFQDENISSLKRVITSRFIANELNGVHLIELNEKKYYCPWSTLNRCLDAYNELKSKIPPALLPFFFDEKREFEFREFQDSFPAKISHIKNETWNIPPRWFGLFKKEERQMDLKSPLPNVKYRTKISDAKKRCTYMHKVVLKTFGEGVLEQEIEVLKEWLFVFNQDSIVELDYGGLAYYLDLTLRKMFGSGIEADSSVDDLNQSLEGLSSADGKIASTAYSSLISKWKQVSEFEHSA